MLKVGEHNIPVNRAQLQLQSPYFEHLFSGNYKKDIQLPLDSSTAIGVEMLLNYLMVGVIVTPQDYSL